MPERLAGDPQQVASEKRAGSGCEPTMECLFLTRLALARCNSCGSRAKDTTGPTIEQNNTMMNHDESNWPIESTGGIRRAIVGHLFSVKQIVIYCVRCVLAHANSPSHKVALGPSNCGPNRAIALTGIAIVSADTARHQVSLIVVVVVVKLRLERPI